MFCENCGNQINNTEKFCDNCGEALEQKLQGVREVEQPKWEMKSPFENSPRNQGVKPIEKQGRRIIFITVGLVLIVAVCLALFYYRKV